MPATPSAFAPAPSPDQGETLMPTVLDANGNPYQAYQTKLGWKCGLALRDWRYVVPVFTPLMIFGLWSLIRRGPRPAAALLIAWALCFYLFFAGV